VSYQGEEAYVWRMVFLRTVATSWAMTRSSRRAVSPCQHRRPRRARFQSVQVFDWIRPPHPTPSPRCNPPRTLRTRGREGRLVGRNRLSESRTVSPVPNAATNMGGRQAGSAATRPVVVRLGFLGGRCPMGGSAELLLARQRRIWSATDSPHSRPRRLCGPCRIPASVALWSSSKVSAFAGKSVTSTLCAAALAAASCEAVIEVRKDSFILESVKFRDELRMSLRSGRQVTASVPCTSS
jgi:hypothetical protein